MKIEKIQRGYLLTRKGGNSCELWRKFNGAESMACDAIDELIAERDALRAKVAEMEKQEPVGVLHVGSYYGEELEDWEFEADQCACDKLNEAYVNNQTSLPLYALPGAQAQPAPSVPDGWKLVPDKHPTFDPVDLRLADGSVLCGCVPQSDGDYWWEGPSGEVFIDPRYAPVTHWRPAAAPEAKP